MSARITLAVAAAAALAVLLATALPAAAATGARTFASCATNDGNACAGYIASGAQFQQITNVAFLRDPVQYSAITNGIGWQDSLRAGTAWDVIVGAAQAAFGWIRDHWPLILGILLGPIAGAVALIVTHWDTIKSALGSAISAMRGLWDAFVGFVTGIPGRILAALAAVGGYIVDAFRSGIDRIQGLLETVVSWFRELPGRIVSALAGLAGQLYNVGVDWMESLLRGITSMGGRIIDKAKSIASDAISFLNPFDSPDTKAFYTGQAVVADYVRGIESRRAQAIGALATIGARATPAASVGAGGRVELVRIDVHVDASALTPGPAIGRAVADALDAFYRTSGARKRVA